MTGSGHTTSSQKTDVQTRTDFYIGGQWVPAGDRAPLVVVDPASELPVGTVPAGTAEDVDVAVAAARAAFGGWSGCTASQRAGFLVAIADGLEVRREEIARMLAGAEITAEARAAAERLLKAATA